MRFLTASFFMNQFPLKFLIRISGCDFNLFLNSPSFWRLLFYWCPAPRATKPEVDKLTRNHIFWELLGWHCVVNCLNIFLRNVINLLAVVAKMKNLSPASLTIKKWHKNWHSFGNIIGEQFYTCINDAGRHSLSKYLCRFPETIVIK
jgi:hypothetical protein